jgi:hypothetical protein
MGIRRIHEFISKRRSLLTVSQVLMPFLNAYSSKGRALSSFSTQSCHLSVPNDIVPKITLDILSPDFPRLFNGNKHQYGEGSLMDIRYRTYSIAAAIALGPWIWISYSVDAWNYKLILGKEGQRGGDVLAFIRGEWTRPKMYLRC